MDSMTFHNGIMAIGKLPLPPSITKDEDKLAGRIEKPLRRRSSFSSRREMSREVL